MKKALSVVVSLVMCFGLVACQASGTLKDTTDTNQKQNITESLWETAIYTEDTETGEGANTVAVVVTAEDKTVTITLHTDEEIFGQALISSGLVTGSEGEYGLFISHVNGMKAVYEEDNAYWAFLDGEGNYMSYGVDEVELTGSDIFCLVHTPA